LFIGRCNLLLEVFHLGRRRSSTSGNYGQHVSAVRRSWVEQIMGLPISVLARGEPAQSLEADAAVHAVFRELADVDAVFSTYKPDSAVSRLARGELTLAQCPPQVREVADRCSWAKDLTGGLFDPTRPDGVWDPSGLVKGWAAERAVGHLAEVAGVDWCLNAGGDVVVVSPSGEPFTIGIQDPRDAGSVSTAVPCSRGGVATSGTAARGAHLYDPRTGDAAASRWLSVSVLGPSLETADVLATAAFIAGDGWPEITGILPGYAGLGIEARGAVHHTAEWPTGGHGTLEA
jgi:FAD:protein FMN transferase